MMRNGYYLDSKGKKIDRFNLEDKIMQVWQLKDDIELLVKRSETMDEDQMINSLIGLESFADMRFNELWETYENMLHNERMDKGIHYELGN